MQYLLVHCISIFNGNNNIYSNKSYSDYDGDNNV